jgi:hypothetical protein
MASDVAPPAPPALRLLVEAPPDRVFLPLVETAARIFAGSLTDAGELIGEVERQLTDAFRGALRDSPESVSITLLLTPGTLEATIAPAGGEEVMLRFATA